MQLFPLSAYRNKRVCVAVSGGVDSVCLLHAFFVRAREYGITLSAVTCDHMIREQSGSDVRFVRELCESWRIPLTCFRMDVPAFAEEQKLGTEEAGRIFRRACFDRVIASGDADIVATAHHGDDYAETILFRLARGTSLAGMRVFTADYARPLLSVSQEEILAYARENRLSYVHDGSNDDTAYARNAIRHNVLPALEACVQGAKQNLVRFARRAAEDDDYLQSLAETQLEKTDGAISFSIGLPKPIFMRACLIAMKSFGMMKDYTAAQLETILALGDSQSGRRIEFANGVVAAREREKLTFYRPSEKSEAVKPFGYGKGRTGDFEYAISDVFPAGAGKVLRIDADAVPKDCVIRVRREGDAFTPYMGGRKTLKKYLTDKKIVSRVGRGLPVLASGSEILAVFGVEIADAVKVTERTKRQAYLQLIKENRYSEGRTGQTDG